MRRGAAVALVAAALSLGGAGRGSGEGYVVAPTGFAPVAVTFRNAAAGELRCVVVLAHFITRTLDPIPPGGAITLSIERHAPSGTLAYGRHDDAPMLVENILCGSDRDWDATRTDLPLTPIRAGAGDSFTCTIAAEAGCEMLP